VRAWLSQVRAIYSREHPVFVRSEGRFRRALSRSAPWPGSSAEPRQSGPRRDVDSTTGRGGPLWTWPSAPLLSAMAIIMAKDRESALAAERRAAEIRAALARARQESDLLRAGLEERLRDWAGSGVGHFVVPEVTPTRDAFVATPRTFQDAQAIADNFKNGRPVVLDLRGVDRDLARRLIDFASGMCYSLSGRIDRTAERTYVLLPGHVVEGVARSDTTPGTTMPTRTLTETPDRETQPAVRLTVTQEGEDAWAHALADSS